MPFNCAPEGVSLFETKSESFSTKFSGIASSIFRISWGVSPSITTSPKEVLIRASIRFTALLLPNSTVSLPQVYKQIQYWYSSDATFLYLQVRSELHSKHVQNTLTHFPSLLPSIPPLFVDAIFPSLFLG